MSERFYRRPIDAPYRERAPKPRSHAVGYLLAAAIGSAFTVMLLVITGMVRP